MSGDRQPDVPVDAFDRAEPIARVTSDEAGDVTVEGTATTESESRRSPAKIPYWDRPKPRRDLHWFLGRLGGSLIVLGILIFLFVGYQLWGTGIEAAQSQNRLEDQFGDIAQTTTSTPEGTPDPEPTPDPVVIRNGDAMAILEMPTLGVTKYVVAGVETADLKKGPGHYPSTPFPGELGNAAIAGHRTTYGEPFRQIDELAPGDPIIVTDLLGRRFVYEVTEQRIVQPEDSWVVDTVDPTVATLTLTTCHPEFSARQRLIVFATLDTTQSTPADTPAAVYAADVGLTSGLDDLEATTTAPVVTTTEPTTEPTSTVVTTTEPAVVGVPDDSGSRPSDDVFDKGWFSDADAYPHVAGWILLEVLIVLGAWQVAKRFRNRAIGAAVGLLPFMVTLYFVFQNVNRLLPPNL